MKHIALAALLAAILPSCSQPEQKSQGWEEQLASQINILGHRNWIVIADMAYPSQSGQGITTLYADEPYAEVLGKVKSIIDDAPHIFAHIYNDMELGYISEEDAPGVSQLRSDIQAICGKESQSVMHEKLIARLDKAGKLFNVVIIKTPLTIPYTTTFFELDCAYWGPEKQKKLDAAISAANPE